MLSLLQIGFYFVIREFSVSDESQTTIIEALHTSRYLRDLLDINIFFFHLNKSFIRSIPLNFRLIKLLLLIQEHLFYLNFAISNGIISKSNTTNLMNLILALLIFFFNRDSPQPLNLTPYTRLSVS